MRFTATEIADAVGGVLVGDDVVCEGASIDTRTIGIGQLFVPIVGERDGHDFIPVAVGAGAAACLSERQVDEPAIPTIVVDDTSHALAALGQVARARHNGPVIGITGSVGKTSVKDLTLAALGGTLVAHASPKSFNNELGVPLTLINAPSNADVLIVEIGARGIGHIAQLCAIAAPTIGIVTWVGAVHTSEFGSVEAVARAKAELVAALPPDGVAILNAECAPVVSMREYGPPRTIMYGSGGEVSAEAVTMDAELRTAFEAVSFGRRSPVSLPVHGVHQVSNALAALAAAEAVGVSLRHAVAGLAEAKLSPWRMELRKAASGATIINDAYNANAISTAAALRSLVELDADRRVAVLGVMAELGERHDRDHREIAGLCSVLGIELIPYREAAYGLPVENSFAAVVGRLGELGPRDAVLVKGSRGMKLERVVRSLLKSDESTPA